MSHSLPSRAPTTLARDRAAAAQFPELASLFAELFARSGGTGFGLSESDFCRVLEMVVSRTLGASPTAAAAAELCRALRVEELALAHACAAGHDAAWDIFLTRYREKLYDAARGIARDEATARELADSIYASLYGLAERAGERVSKLASYTGRGSLEGWLRTVLAQEYINRYRSTRRLVSLEEEEEAGRQFEAAAAPDGEAVVDPRLAAATDEALAALSAEERFLLASYFLDGRTLAEIARMLRVHESTISRRLEKVAVSMRRAIREALLRRGLSRRQADEALDTDVRDLAVDVRARLRAARPAQERAQEP